MREKAGSPAIRFAGFTEDWERRKLGDCFDERQERSAFGELISVTINDGIKKFSELGRHDSSSEDKSNYKKVEIGDIAYNSMRMWQGASGYSPYSGILSPAYTVLIPKEGVNSLFFSYAFKRPAMIHTFQVNSQGITSDTWNLKYPALSEIGAALPSEAEQAAVGGFFCRLDRLITLHQRKCAQLCGVKRSMLEKLFPRDGAAVPEIRFAGFTGDWERHKFSDIAARVGITSEAPDLPRVEYEDINSGQGTLNKDLHEKASVKAGTRFQPGDVLYGKLRPYLKNWLFADFSGIAVGDFWVLRGNEIDGLFLYFLIQSDTFDDAANQSTGTKMPRADWPLVSKTELYIPRQASEQQRIGKLLLNLDHLIALHQKKLEHLQNIKKSCLEKMFV